MCGLMHACVLKNICRDGLWIRTAVLEPVHAPEKVQLLPTGLVVVQICSLLKGPALRCFCTASWGTVGTGGHLRSDSWMKRQCGVCNRRYTHHDAFGVCVLSSLVTWAHHTCMELFLFTSCLLMKPSYMHASMHPFL